MRYLGGYTAEKKRGIMTKKSLDYRGLRCPEPSLKLALESHSMQPGDILDVIADCPTFEEDVKNWCMRHKKALLLIKPEGNAKRCQVRV